MNIMATLPGGCKTHDAGVVRGNRDARDEDHYGRKLRIIESGGMLHVNRTPYYAWLAFLLTLIGVLVSDLLYGIVDPRIRHE